MELENSVKHELTLGNILEILEADAIVETDDWKETVIASTCASDLMSDVLTLVKPNCLLLTGLTSTQVVRTAEIANLKALCFVRGKLPDEEVIELAREINLPLIATKFSMVESCGRLYCPRLRGITDFGA
ncbi:MAG: DRTGG domain-containing protein [Candidatus Eremiobacteraeota bacterium]|nr:DRTGG domain-containing protein [Candidatus Eremiobacteraeota bacterium]